MHTPQFWIFLGLFVGLVISFRESRSSVRIIAFTCFFLIVGLAAISGRRGSLPEKEVKWPLESCGGNDWIQASLKDRMMVCEVFASNRLAGNNTDYSAGDYFDAINSYYDSGGDKAKSVKWVADTAVFHDQKTFGDRR
jgi:hypothetical protein